MFLYINDIVNQNDFKEIAENSICPICQQIYYEPVQCQLCQHFFCKQCIGKWLRQSNQCPFKCKELNFLENKSMNDYLSILKFKCRNGCNEIIPYLNIKKHYEEECPKIDFKEKYFEILKKYNELSNLTNIHCTSLSIYHNHEFESQIYGANMFLCDICEKSLKSRDHGYCCRICDFDICDDCANKLNKGKSNHIHPLELSRPLHYQCSLCNKSFKYDEKAMCCLQCNYFECFNCYIYN